MRNRILFSIVLIAALAGSGACNRTRRRSIAVIPKGTSHLFWLSVQAGALAAGKQFNVDILWNGPSQETEYDRQMQIVDSMVARHVDGIALAAAERTALVQSVDRAASAGIPVVIFDSGVDSTRYVSFLSTNNYEAGQLAGRALAGFIGGHGNVALVMHAPGSFSTMDRERGFEDVLQAEFPKVKIVASQFGMADRAKARAATENILTANPSLDGLFTSSEPSSVGAALALKSQGRAGKTHFVAFDSSDTMIQDLRDGVIDAMVVQDPFKMGFEAVQTVVQKLDGQTPPARIDLHARVIRKADLDDPEVKQLLRIDSAK